jgi:hypothetical protein
VDIFDADSTPVSKFSIVGYSVGIAVDPANYVYVGDTGNNQTEVYNANGNPVYTFGSYGSGNGYFYDPMGIAFGSPGTVYVADALNDRIQEFSLPNTTISSEAQVSLVSSTYILNLVTGWDLVSFPVSGSGLMESNLLGNSSLNILMMAVFNNSTQSYSTYTGSPLDVNEPLSPDTGFFVYCSRPSLVYLTGSAPSAHDINIVDGWNMIGWSGASTVDASDIMSDLSPHALMVAMYNPSAQGFVTYTGSPLDVDFSIAPGTGFFVYSDSSTKLYTGA